MYILIRFNVSALIAKYLSMLKTPIKLIVGILELLIPININSA